MKFAVGDVVRYTDPNNLVREFYDQWANGPFVVIKEPPEDGLRQLHCSTMDGGVVTMPNGEPWGFDQDGLIVDQFLTAARKANLEGV